VRSIGEKGGKYGKIIERILWKDKSNIEDGCIECVRGGGRNVGK